ncbi:MAG: tRNA pseudouridine(38-40) synthase TruA [Gammaproteobacteria bacterium]|nr:MAG: tRNA pseudouridine(38-40) synthase TruA [Gammaproteobacteria bacterium]
MRIALGLEYDGTDFVGWQSQRDGRSVQDLLTVAIATVADHPVTVFGSGRTDAGVHAAQQIAHFDTAASREPRQWLLGINSRLPADIAVQWVKEVKPEFDARRSALWRRYRYLLRLRGTRSALSRRRAWWLHDSMDCGAMSAAGAAWLGENDFSAFRAAGCRSSTPMRRLISVGIHRRESLIALEFTANAFLQHMVRNLVGVLVEIGTGRAAQSWAAEVLAGRDRTQGGMAAPAQGLTLIEVAYPEHFDLPARPDNDADFI